MDGRTDGRTSCQNDEQARRLLQGASRGDHGGRAVWGGLCFLKMHKGPVTSKHTAVGRGEQARGHKIATKAATAKLQQARRNELGCEG